MSFVLPALKKNKNGSEVVRQAIPADVRDDYGHAFGNRWEERWRPKAGTPYAQQKRECAEWLALINRRIETFRAAQRGEGIDLSHKDALALAGEWYLWFVARHDAEPGKPDDWDLQQWQLYDALMEHAPDEVREKPQTDLRWTHDPDVRAGIRPVLADRGLTAQFLASKGLALTQDAQARFLNGVLDNYVEALFLLERRARGDYAPDELPKQFPRFTGRKGASGTGPSPWKLFEGWERAKKPARSTVNRYRAVFKALDDKFPDAASITEDDAQAWARELITPKRTAVTVRDIWVSGAHTVYGWAKSERLIATNPFAAVTVTVPRKIKTRENDAFTEEEARTILRSALAVTDTRKPFSAAKRWAPWLSAYSGARMGEITQLRGSDMEQRGPFHVMKLTPEAGTIKTGRARTVPLHEHIIEQGFLKFIQTRGKGPLFYNADTDASPEDDRLNPKRSRAVKARERLGAWVRSLGIKDPEVQPNHAWRDTFKQRAERHGISERTHDVITGHKNSSEGRGYRARERRDRAIA